LRVFGQQITGAGHQSGDYASGDPGGFTGASECVRGAPEYEGDGIDLMLPANSRTSVSWQIALAATPWVSQVPAVRWLVGVPASADSSSQITDRQIGPQTFHVRGRTGVAIRLHAGAGAHAPAGHTGLPYRTINAGQRAMILGTTRPRLNHAPIQLTYAATVGHHHGMIGTAITGPYGTFAINWQPRTRGIDTITAAVRDPPARLLPDRSCDLALDVK
jgi:hypothetical protein